jgi:hypothetical protein
LYHENRHGVGTGTALVGVRSALDASMVEQVDELPLDASMVEQVDELPWCPSG